MNFMDYTQIFFTHLFTLKNPLNDIWEEKSLSSSFFFIKNSSGSKIYLTGKPNLITDVIQQTIHHSNLYQQTCSISHNVINSKKFTTISFHSFSITLESFFISIENQNFLNTNTNFTKFIVFISEFNMGMATPFHLSLIPANSQHYYFQYLNHYNKINEVDTFEKDIHYLASLKNIPLSISFNHVSLVLTKCSFHSFCMNSFPTLTINNEKVSLIIPKKPRESHVFFFPSIGSFCSINVDEFNFSVDHSHNLFQKNLCQEIVLKPIQNFIFEPNITTQDFPSNLFRKYLEEQKEFILTNIYNNKTFDFISSFSNKHFLLKTIGEKKFIFTIPNRCKISLKELSSLECQNIAEFIEDKHSYKLNFTTPLLKSIEKNHGFNIYTISTKESTENYPTFSLFPNTSQIINNFSNLTKFISHNYSYLEDTYSILNQSFTKLVNKQSSNIFNKIKQDLSNVESQIISIPLLVSNVSLCTLGS